MRASFVFAAVAGVAVGFLGAPGANAMTNTSPAGVRVATEAMDTSALVHCRPYRHMHEWEHRRTFGCRGGSSVEIRRGHRERVGVGEREGSRHSRTTTHSETSVRGSTTPKTGESTKSSTGHGKTGETKSGTGTKPESSGRAKGGEKSSTGGSSGGASGGTSGAQPSGQKQ